MTLTRRHWLLGPALMATVVVAAACGGDDDDGDTAQTEGNGGEATDGEEAASSLEGAELTVGSKQFTEQLILGQIAIIALEDAGASVTDETGLASTDIVRTALVEGDVDMYWEYTGTGWLNILQQDEPVAGAEAQYEAVAEMDLEENGIRWLEPGVFDNTYAIAAHQSAIEEFGLSTISDVGTLLEENPDAATFCVAEEFLGRPDGLPGLEQAYGFEFPDENLVTLDEGLIYERAAERSDCNLAEVFATDGRIAALDLVVLEDNMEFFPVYNPAMTMRDEIYQQYPQLADLFNPIIQAIDSDTMAQLNAQVDAEGAFPEEVAQEWLSSEGFIE